MNQQKPENYVSHCIFNNGVRSDYCEYSFQRFSVLKEFYVIATFVLSGLLEWKNPFKAKTELMV